MLQDNVVVLIVLSHARVNFGEGVGVFGSISSSLSDGLKSPEGAGEQISQINQLFAAQHTHIL